MRTARLFAAIAITFGIFHGAYAANRTDMAIADAARIIQSLQQAGGMPNPAAFNAEARRLGFTQQAVDSFWNQYTFDMVWAPWTEPGNLSAITGVVTNQPGSSVQNLLALERNRFAAEAALVAAQTAILKDLAERGATSVSVSPAMRASLRERAGLSDAQIAQIERDLISQSRSSGGVTRTYQAMTAQATLIAYMGANRLNESVLIREYFDLWRHVFRDPESNVPAAISFVNFFDNNVHDLVRYAEGEAATRRFHMFDIDPNDPNRIFIYDSATGKPVTAPADYARRFGRYAETIRTNLNLVQEMRLLTDPTRLTALRIDPASAPRPARPPIGTPAVPENARERDRLTRQIASFQTQLTQTTGGARQEELRDAITALQRQLSALPGLPPPSAPQGVGTIADPGIAARGLMTSPGAGFRPITALPATPSPTILNIPRPIK